jgi:DNA-binding SARP family transcriptional activator
MDKSITDLMDTGICISALDTGKVLYANPFLLERAGFAASGQMPETSAELFHLHGGPAAEYINADLSGADGFCKFLPDNTVLKSRRSVFEGADVRVDTLFTFPNEQFGAICGAVLKQCEFERYIKSYHGVYFPDENISEGLYSANSIYNADIAFILHMDTELNAFRIMAAEYRSGLEGFDDILAHKLMAKNLFCDMVKPSKPLCIAAEDLKEKHTPEHRWMIQNGVSNVMLYPILTRTQMQAFIGVCNVRRFYGDLSMLALTRMMLSNEIRAITVMDRNADEVNRSAALEDNDIVINMFGGFEIRTVRGKLGYSSFASSKCCLMLIYLIFNRDRTVPVRELAEILWPNQLFDNPYDMVKGVAFRLRKILDPICDKKVVIARHGTYAFNDELCLILDTGSFDTICEQLRQMGLSVKDRQMAYQRIIQCYKGNLLPNFEDEIWLIGRIIYYQVKYWGIVKEYLLLLDQIGQFEKFLSVASQAMNIVHPDADIYQLIITSLIRQNRLDMARSFYLKAEKILSPEQRQTFIDLWNKLSVK